MSKKGSQKDVRPIARQFVLSGFRDKVQQEDVYGDGNKKQLVRKENNTSGPNWKQKVYQATVSFIIEETSLGSEQHEYTIRLNDNANLLVCAYSKRGKKAIGEPVAIPQKKGSPKALAMVYGIHEDGECTLSHPDGQVGARRIAELYSFLLGQINDAIQYRLQQLENSSGDDDTGQRDKSSLTRANVGEHPKTRRGKKIRTEILPKTVPEESPVLVEVGGKVLGVGQGDELHYGSRVGNDPLI